MSRYELMMKLTLSRQSSKLLRNSINSIIRLNSTPTICTLFDLLFYWVNKLFIINWRRNYSVGDWGNQDLIPTSGDQGRIEDQSESKQHTSGDQGDEQSLEIDQAEDISNPIERRKVVIEHIRNSLSDTCK